MTAEALARAKVNLSLHLTGLRADGYHLLDSLVVFAEFGDVLTVRPAAELSLRVSGPLSKGVPVDGSNLVLRAADHMRRLRGVTAGAEISLEKHLPHGGGIGGGSADAAAALHLLADLWSVAPLGVEEALALGADIPVCLSAPRPMRMQGIGDELTRVPDLPPCWLVLVNPGVTVPTGAVFDLHDRRFPAEGAGMDASVWTGYDSFVGWLQAQRNDLTRAACDPSIAPVIADVIGALSKGGADASDMSGSGATCWGLFPTEKAANRAAAAVTAKHPDWWVHAVAVATGGNF